MKVLLAGAGGATGIPLTRRLIAHDHQVLGLTRDQAGAGRLAALDARPVVADAVVHELTALRKPPLRHGGMALTDRLRTEGSSNLLAAAEALGARRFLTQSFVLGDGYRDHGARVLTEQDPFGRPEGGRSDPHLAAMRSAEQQAFSAPPPRRLPGWLLRLAAPYVASFAVGASMRVSNAKAKAELGWQPRFPSYREGIQAMGAAVPVGRAAGGA
jgi:nucleoside-diphosphate-sugar epimerase